MSERANEPAFPCEPQLPKVVSGLSKREWLAGLAMQGMLPTANKKERGWGETVAESAVIMADQVLAQLDKKGSE